MADLQRIVEFLFFNMRQVAVLYTGHLILAFSFSIFVLQKVFDLLHKIKD